MVSTTSTPVETPISTAPTSVSSSPERKTDKITSKGKAFPKADDIKLILSDVSAKS